MNLSMHDGLDHIALRAAIVRLEGAIRNRYPAVRHIYLELGDDTATTPATNPVA